MIRLKVFGVPIQFSFLFIALLSLMLFLDQSGVAFWGSIAAALHEIGHVVALWICHNKPALLSFEVTGIRLVEGRKGLSFFCEIFVLGAGCMVNLMLFLLSLHFGWFTFATANFCVGSFNLLPSGVLDGGRILQTVLSQFLSTKTVHLICRIISLLLVLFLLIVGVFLFLASYNPTLLLTAFYLLVAFIFR